ncbi:MAG: 16S rRNA (adenine(1518)-N(6)/adenine(1519)-N(6))-dimethyltransferase RsmA [Pseudomonadota bacterium]
MSDGLPPLREVIACHGLSARKALGQNFLLDLNLTRKIARAAAPTPEDHFIEIGPGPGGLTRALLMEGAGRVTAIEKDPRCIAALEDIAGAYPGQLTVVEADAMDYDFSALGPHKIAANLPYNVGTALLTRWLEPKHWPPQWASLTLLFQKEVAERLTAAPGSKAYGRLSILAQWRSQVRSVFDIGPKAFTPPPKVTSALVHITAGTAAESVKAQDLSKITAAAFGQRRKMLRQSLKSLTADPMALCDAAGIAPTLRADALGLEDYLNLARALRQAPQP